MFRLLLIFFTMVLVGKVVNAGTPQLSVQADTCAIYRAFGLGGAQGCPDLPAVGTARSVSVLDQVDLGAVPPAPLSSEQGYFIRFSFNSAQLTPEYQDHLTRLAQVMDSPQAADLCFKLIGHTDAVGGDAYNDSLSSERARMVHLYLVGVAQVSATRLSFEGRGERSLLPSVPADHGLNRRVEILARPQSAGPCQG